MPLFNVMYCTNEKVLKYNEEFKNNIPVVVCVYATGSISNTINGKHLYLFQMVSPKSQKSDQFPVTQMLSLAHDAVSIRKKIETVDICISLTEENIETNKSLEEHAETKNPSALKE